MIAVCPQSGRATVGRNKALGCLSRRPLLIEGACAEDVRRRGALDTIDRIAFGGGAGVDLARDLPVPRPDEPEEPHAGFEVALRLLRYGRSVLAGETTSTARSGATCQGRQKSGESGGG